jgi:hypothetical protein
MSFASCARVRHASLIALAFATTLLLASAASPPSASAALTCASNNTTIHFDPPLNDRTITPIISVESDLGGCLLGTPTAGRYFESFRAQVRCRTSAIFPGAIFTSPFVINWNDRTSSFSQALQARSGVTNAGLAGAVLVIVDGDIEAGYERGSPFIHEINAVFDPADCADGIESLPATLDVFQIL